MSPFVLSLSKYERTSGLRQAQAERKINFIHAGAIAGFFLLIFSAVAAAQEIKPFSSGSYQQILSAHQGKPFILNFWSLSCAYCRDELAIFKKLAKKYPKLDLVLVSTDTSEEAKSVSATLSEFSLGKAEAWVFADSNTERLRFEIDRKWYGELPRTYFVGAKNDVKAVSGKFEQKDAEQWISDQQR